MMPRYWYVVHYSDVTIRLHFSSAVYFEKFKSLEKLKEQYRMHPLEPPCRSHSPVIITLYNFYSFLGLPGSSNGEESACNAGDLGSIPGSGRSPGEGDGNPLQYSCLENSMDRGALAGCSPWGCKESDMTEQLPLSLFTLFFCIYVQVVPYTLTFFFKPNMAILNKTGIMLKNLNIKTIIF